MTPALDPVFRALGDPTRREILRLLRSHEAATGEIAARFSLSRPTVSKHLGVLVDAELVRRRKEGRHQIYQLNAAPLEQAHEWLSEYQRFWQTRLTGLKRYVEDSS